MMTWENQQKQGTWLNPNCCHPSQTLDCCALKPEPTKAGVGEGSPCEAVRAAAGEAGCGISGSCQIDARSTVSIGDAAAGVGRAGINVCSTRTRHGTPSVSVYDVLMIGNA
jgi:hypothetical protein